MPNWNGLIITKKGRDLQAKVEAGKIALNLTKMKIGSGTLPTGQQLENLTDLVEPKQNIGIALKEVTENGLCRISATITNSELNTGYYVKELGVFAQDPDNGEILYAITADTAPDYLPAQGGATVVSQEFAVYIAIGNASDITAKIDPTALATMGYVQSTIDTHNKDANAHSAAINKHNSNASAHSDFKGASTSAAGKRGMVPAPGAGAATRYLRSDGLWVVPPDTDTKYGVVSTTANGLCPKRDGAATKVLVADGTWKDVDVLDMTPVGDVVFRPFLKKGYVKANGATVNRADYPRLVAFANANNLWTSNPANEPWKFGQGNGSTTMVLPNYIGRFIQGGDSSAVKQAGLPNITGNFGSIKWRTYEAKGAFIDMWDNVPHSWSQENKDEMRVIRVEFDASRVNYIYGNNSTVQPPAISLLPQIRY